MQTKSWHPPGPRSRDGHAQCYSSEPSSSTKEALALCKSQHNEVVHELDIPFYTAGGNLWILKVQTQRSCVFRTACYNVDIRSYRIILYESFDRWQVRLSLSFLILYISASPAIGQIHLNENWWNAHLESTNQNALTCFILSTSDMCCSEESLFQLWQGRDHSEEFFT